jgi:hypothetical protein
VRSASFQKSRKVDLPEFRQTVDQEKVARIKQDAAANRRAQDDVRERHNHNKQQEEELANRNEALAKEKVHIPGRNFIPCRS